MRITLIAVLLVACSHGAIVDPCETNGARRQFGHKALRTREGVTSALVFVQGSFRDTAVHKELFWPERTVGDALFGAYDIHLIVLRPRGTIRELIDDMSLLSQYQRILFVTHDVRHTVTIDRAVALLSPEQRAGVRGTFVFHTPATDDALRRRPRASSLEERTASTERRTVCSTFDRSRMSATAAVAACDEVIVAQMSAGMQAASPCDDVLYDIFREGLMSTVYETEHVIPRWSPPQQ